MHVAPFCGMVLADFGATVIRIDRMVGMNPDNLARGKKSISVDLKEKKSLEIIFKLIEKADVLIEPFRPGVAEKLGFGPKEALQKNPKLIYARLTGFGQTGYYANLAGHDINYLSISGALSAFGRKGENPIFPLNILTD